ncbi:MAG: SelD-related putative sulfur metabolism protein [Thaumarchaeota archaeon]|nr:SelD-related putative sulfur metabolism protein [Nitrososphaerota archaeon]
MPSDTVAIEEFWDRVARYREMGMDPLRWVAGCAVKVDLTTVVYPALRRLRPTLKGLGVTVGHREDADIFPLGKEEPVVTRRIYDPKKPSVDSKDLKRINPKRAISLVQVHQRGAENEKTFGDFLLSVYNEIGKSGINFFVGKGHSIITAYPDAEFTLFDFISHKEGGAEGWTLANNDTIQVIDPTLDPGSAEQTEVGVCNSLNDLITLGCYENLRLLPVIDAPNEELAKKVYGHMKAFAAKNGIKMVDAESPNKRKLLIGATFLGDMRKEPPIHEENLEEGMKVLVSRPLGDLAPINTYLSALADEAFMKALEEQGSSLEEVQKAKNQVIATMRLPNLKIGKIINEYLPEYWEAFDPSEHIVSTGDVSGPGILIFQELAEKAKVDIALNEIPLGFPKFVKFVTEHFLMDNATAGTNGAVAIIARDSIINEVQAKLRKEGYEPKVIGMVLGKGEGVLRVGEEVTQMIASQPQLNELVIERK